MRGNRSDLSSAKEVFFNFPSPQPSPEGRGRKTCTVMHHCRNFARPPMTRREMLSRCAGGFGAVALAAMMADETRHAGAAELIDASPFAAKPSHFRPRAKNVICGLN